MLEIICGHWPEITKKHQLKPTRLDIPKLALWCPHLLLFHPTSCPDGILGDLLSTQESLHNSSHLTVLLVNLISFDIFDVGAMILVPFFSD